MHELPNIAELYASASNAKDLSIYPAKRCHADVLIAAGWVHDDFGTALIRLQGEYDSAAKPACPSSTDFALFVSRLKTMDKVRQALERWAKLHQVNNPVGFALAIACHWLDDVCRPCKGRGFQPIPDTPALSDEVCNCCGGTGRNSVPYGRLGKEALAMMDACVQRAKQEMCLFLREHVI